MGGAFDVDSEASGEEGSDYGAHERGAALEGFGFGAEAKGWSRHFQRDERRMYKEMEDLY